MDDQTTTPQYRVIDNSIPANIRFPPLILIAGVLFLSWVIWSGFEIQSFCEDKFDPESKTFEGGSGLSSAGSSLLDEAPRGADCTFSQSLGPERIDYRWNEEVKYQIWSGILVTIGFIWWVERDSGTTIHNKEYYCPKCENVFDYISDRTEKITGVFESTSIVNTQSSTTGFGVGNDGSTMGYSATTTTPVSVSSLIGRIEATHTCEKCQLEMKWSYETEVRSIWRPETQKQDFEIIGEKL